MRRRGAHAHAAAESERSETTAAGAVGLLLVELGIVIGTESLGDICDSVKNNQPLSQKAMVGESGEDDL